MKATRAQLTQIVKDAAETSLARMKDGKAAPHGFIHIAINGGSPCDICFESNIDPGDVLDILDQLQVAIPGIVESVKNTASKKVH